MIVAAGGLVYGGFQEGILRALSPATGAGIWQRTTAGPVTIITPGPRVIYVNAAGPPDTIHTIWQLHAANASACRRSRIYGAAGPIRAGLPASGKAPTSELSKPE